MAVDVAISNEQGDALDLSALTALAQAVLAAEGVNDDAELSVLFVDETAIAELNERYLGHVGPTDVLSFPLEDDPRAADGRKTGRDVSRAQPPLLLGDVVICPAVARHQCAEHGSTYEEELALLLVHGILHVLGRDHEVDEEADEMEAREQELLERYFRSTPKAAP